MIDSKPIVIGVTVLLAGCATLKVAPLDVAGSNVGIGYVLPFTQYAVTTSWRLDYCPDPNALKPGVDEVPRIAVKVDVVSGSADDADLAYIINPQDLQTLTSVTSFTAKWFDGRNLFSSIGASVDDHSAQVVGNLVKTAIKIAPLFAGLPPLPGAAATKASDKPVPKLILCRDEGAKALVKAHDAKGVLLARTKAVEAATDALTAAAAKVATMGAAVSENAKTDYDAAITKLDKATSDEDDAATALSEALKPITYVHKILWPETGDEFSHGPEIPDIAAVSKWVDKPNLEQQHVYFQIERTGSFGRNPASFNPKPAPLGRVTMPGKPPRPALAKPVVAKTVAGLPYRMPAAGRLVVCSISPCRGADVATVLASLDGPVVQLGYVNILPFRSRAFGSNSFSAEFGLDGSLKNVGYEQKTAPAEGATGALLDSATQVAGALDPTAKLTTSNAYLKALKDQQDNLKALQPATADPGAAAISSLDADTALINARLANLQASIALVQAQKSVAQ